MTSTLLFAAAFGDRPDLWPLPPAQTATDLWLRAVAAGGQGRYSSARADLAELMRRRPSGPLASLVLSTQASFLRQLGCHHLARGWDGRALEVARSVAEPGVDAMVGLAADALGMGRLALSATLLDRADEMAAASEGTRRMAIRRAWVGAELAMARGDGTAALGHARRAVELADEAAPALRRHRVKSDVVLAAALCCAGAQGRSRTVADAALPDAVADGLVPLAWALACLLADIGSATQTREQVAELRDGCAETISRRGGRWCGR